MGESAALLVPLVLLVVGMLVFFVGCPDFPALYRLISPDIRLSLKYPSTTSIRWAKFSITINGVSRDVILAEGAPPSPDALQFGDNSIYDDVVMGSGEYAATIDAGESVDGVWKVVCGAQDAAGKDYPFADPMPVTQVVPGSSRQPLYEFLFELNGSTGKISGSVPGMATTADVTLSLTYSGIKATDNNPIDRVKFVVTVDNKTEPDLIVTPTGASPSILGVMPVLDAANHANRAGKWQVTLPKARTGNWVVQCAAFRKNDPSTTPGFPPGKQGIHVVAANTPFTFPFTLVESPNRLTNYTGP